MLYIIYFLAGWKAIDIIIKTVKEIIVATRLYIKWKNKQNRNKKDELKKVVR